MKTQQIVRRIVSPKRHTVGYVLTGGRRVTRYQAIQLAMRNEIRGVRVVGSGSSRYLQSSGSRALYTLPISLNETDSKKR